MRAGAVNLPPAIPLERRKDPTLADGFVILAVSPNWPPCPDVPWQWRVSGHLPSIALICETCGHTELFNVLRLGLGSLVGATAEVAEPSSDVDQGDPRKGTETRMRRMAAT